MAESEGFARKGSAGRRWCDDVVRTRAPMGSPGSTLRGIVVNQYAYKCSLYMQSVRSSALPVKPVQFDVLLIQIVVE